MRAAKQKGDVMDASHVVVSVLTLGTLGLLAWIEIRSRRNGAALEGGTPQEAAHKSLDNQR
jgi:hypothetical protein